MVDPSYLVFIGVAPTLLCVAIIQWLRQLRIQRGVWSFTRILRRRPSPNWNSYGEMLFLLVLVTINVLVFWYGFTKKHGHKPRFTGDPPRPPGPPSGHQYVKMIGNALGFNCLFNMALLFLPATRNSVWMELMNVSYANAIRFHRWVGVVAVLTGIVHCGCYYYTWLMDGSWKQKALPCWDCSLRERTGRKIWINVFGEVALLCFLLIGVTSIPWIRRKMYNLFYNVHQLLFVAVFFTALHWARAIWFLLPSFVGYLISRVLSRCNGANAVKVIEFSALSPSLCKLVIARTSSERGRYKVGQFVYVNVPAISSLEWHAFTIASSPRTSSYETNSNTLTLLIKSLGDWTEKLMMYQQVCERCAIEPEVYVDGYYGASLADVYHDYNTVILVGGGVGMTPLLSVLEDACSAAETRQAQGRTPLPRRVIAIFIMRELELLKEIYPLLARVRDLDPQGRYFSVNLTLTAIPRPDELDSTINFYKKPLNSLPADTFSHTRTFASNTKTGCPFGASFGPSGSSIVHFVAFVVVVGLVGIFQFGNGKLIDGLQDSVWLVQLSIKTIAMFAAGICVYGGVVLVRTTRWVRGARAVYKQVKVKYPLDELDLVEILLPQTRRRDFSQDILTFRDLLNDLRVPVGKRPDLVELLHEHHRDHHERQSDESPIGVIVSGPTSLKTATSRAVASISASHFDIHEEEFEL
ncbi:hypothetical protein PHMEG_00011007 [Phytophthora megakarya]|uniref:FAD-binding FR-type domain-containing protein n=1 Tax=Phytophthora megakarya TaxID=4795 RepID=A0A225WCK3_9STRA|nr:hypothetical protein PHMEG_00011007 [Phytophthora megakarya]